MITHLQFVKPNMIAPTGELRVAAEPEGRILRAHRGAYRRVLDAFNAHLSAQAVAHLRACCPEARVAPATTAL